MKISIITINYNNKLGLERTIKSVIQQSWQDFEYLIIDGGSSDGSVDIIKDYNSRINYWISEKDNGIYNAMNKGIRKAKGEYLLFLNSGDILQGNHSLFDVNQYVKEFDIISFNLQVIGEASNFIKSYPSKISFSYFLEDTLPHPATFIKRDSFEKVGFYDENLRIVSDWKWFLVALFKHNLSHIHYNKVFSVFYLDGLSSNKDSYNLIQNEKRSTLNNEFLRFYNEFLQIKDSVKFRDKLNNNLLYKFYKFSVRIRQKISKLIR